MQVESIQHTRWECQYHVVFIPKRRRKTMYINIRKELGDVFKELASHKECKILDGAICSDHVHMRISIPPKCRVCDVVGYIKGKSAIYIARHFTNIKKNYTGEHFWARGYFVSTVGRDEKTIKEYIMKQDEVDARLDRQLRLDIES